MPELVITESPGVGNIGSGPQWGVPFTLEGPDGTKAVFNDSTSAHYAGILIPEECSGLDSAEVRENLADRTELDGAIQGPQYYGRRPIVLTGAIPATSTIVRNEMMARIKRASNAMRANATLTWTPDGGEQLFATIRRQAPLRITGAWLKKFQIPLVAADARLYATTIQTGTIVPGGAGTVTLTNNGDGEAPLTATIFGPIENPTLTNEATGQSINLTYKLAKGEKLVLDFLARTIKLAGTTNKYSALNFATSTWWLIQPGENKIKLAQKSYEKGAEVEFSFRDAWV